MGLIDERAIWLSRHSADCCLHSYDDRWNGIYAASWYPANKFSFYRVINLSNFWQQIRGFDHEICAM